MSMLLYLDEVTLDLFFGGRLCIFGKGSDEVCEDNFIKISTNVVQRLCVLFVADGN